MKEHSITRSKKSILKQGNKKSENPEADHKLTKQALPESEDLYRMALEIANDGIAVLQNDRYVYANKKFLGRMGRTKDDIIGRKFGSFVPSDNINDVYDDYNKILKGLPAPNRFEAKVDLPDGSIMYAEYSMIQVQYQGQPSILITANDITERKKMEVSLKESNEQFNALFDGSLDGIYLHDLRGNYLNINPVGLETIGYSREELATLNVSSLLDKEQILKARQLIDGLLKDGIQQELFECKIKCRNGNYVDAEIGVALIQHEGKPHAIIGIARDISKRKKIEEALRASEERYRLLVEYSHDTLYTITADGIFTFASSNWTRMTGHTQNQIIGKHFRDFVHPDDFEKCAEFQRRLVETGQQDDNIEYRVRHIDGSWRWNLTKMSPLTNSAGEIITYVGTARDITDRKNAEKALKDAYDKLESRVQERAAELSEVIDTLREKEQLLEAESNRLSETNIALKVLLQHREDDKKELEMKVLNNARKLILPYIEKLKESTLSPQQAVFTEIIESNINNIISPFLNNLTASYLNFTPREIEVANLTREGKSAKDIAWLLNSSIDSVLFHKHNIRKKLGLNKTKTNLRTYLLSLTNTALD